MVPNYFQVIGVIKIIGFIDFLIRNAKRECMGDFIAKIQDTASVEFYGIIVLSVYIVIAVVLRLFIVNVLLKLTKYTKTNFDDEFLLIIKSPILATVMIAGFLHFHSLISFHYADYASIVRNFFVTVLVISWMMAIIRLSIHINENLIHKLFDIAGLQKDILPLINIFLKILIFVIGFFFILSIWQIDLTPVLASAGIISAAVAIAAKDTIGNFFAGVAVFVDKPYKIGDWINLDNSERGEVIEIGMRSTRVKTMDNILITIPNSIIANSKIINESAPILNFRFKIPISVAYDSDTDKVEELLLDIARSTENVLSEPAPAVRMCRFGDHGIEFELLCWANEPPLKDSIIHAINKQIISKFRNEQITIPYPQRDVRIIKN